MSNRRAFLKEVGSLTALSPFLAKGVHAPQVSARAVLPDMSSAVNPVASAPQRTYEVPFEFYDWHRLQYKPHWIRQADGRGGWVLQPAQIRYVEYGDPVPYYQVKGDGTMIFGVAQMDNGEVIALGTWDSGEAVKDPRFSSAKPIVGFSRDGGNTWTEFKQIENGNGRPLMLTYLGRGDLMFQTDLVKPIMQYFSHDYGRTWPERRPLQLTSFGTDFQFEGAALVDRDASGVAKRIAQAGYTVERGMKPWTDTPPALIRWSSDGGRTWTDETVPKAWQYNVEYQDKIYLRGVNEGSLVRAANGWIVAALRTDLDPEFLPLRLDNMEGIGVSISKDDGKTWTPIRRLIHAGRMHTDLTVMPNGHTVLSFVERQDVEDGRLASYRRGCGAILSRDNGLTWDMEHRYILDAFDFSDGTPFALACGHQRSTLLDNGQILTCYSNYTAKSGVLIRWKPSPD